jgi:hypothetical protein
MTNDLKRLAALAGLATVCLAGLAGCGGGGADAAGDGLTEQQREDRLASTWPGMLTFALAQIARQDADVADPRGIAAITPPLSETDEPASL